MAYVFKALGLRDVRTYVTLLNDRGVRAVPNIYRGPEQNDQRIDFYTMKSDGNVSEVKQVGY